MTAFLNDTMTGTAGDAVTSHSPDTGGSWDNPLGSNTVKLNGSGFAYNDSAINTQGGYRNAATPSGADYTVTGVFKRADATGLDAAVIFGRMSASDYARVALEWDSDGTTPVLKEYDASNSPTTLDTGSSLSWASGASKTFELIFSGTGVTAKIGGTTVATGTTSITGAGKAGFLLVATTGSSTQGMQLDSISAEVTSAPTSTTLTATVKDSGNNPLAGRSVTISSANTAVCTVSPSSGTTDSNGQVSTTVSSVASGGPVTVTFTCEGVDGTSAITVS